MLQDGETSRLAGIGGESSTESGHFLVENGRCRDQSCERQWEYGRAVLDDLAPGHIPHQYVG
jgi:hypothetical protein